MWSLFRKSSNRSATDDSLAFALDLYRRLGNAGQNLVCSPWSVQSVLSLLLAGARGETAAALGIVPAAREITSVGFQSANSLWLSDNVTLLPSYIEAVSTGGGAALQMLPGENGAAAINEWVAERTLQRISHLLDSLSDLTRLVIVNAIALNARWAAKFEPESTSPGQFRTGHGAPVHVPMMRGRRTVPYIDSDRLGAQAIELRYADSSLAMVLILPREDVSLTNVEARLESGDLALVLKSLHAQVVDIAIPRFSCRNRVEHLDHALREQGLDILFDVERADFSGMSGEPPGTDRSLLVETVVQEATIDVDEGGTVATAATLTPMRLGAAMIRGPSYPVFRANRPFLFLIRDGETGAVVFIGRIVDPGGHVEPPDDPFLRRRMG